MGMSDILAIIALIISITSFFFNFYLNNRFYGPESRVIVNSIPKGFKIQFENVGDRIMHIDRISYSVVSDGTAPVFTENLSSIFYDIPCETRAEIRLKKVNLFSNSKHNLITTTFFNQDDLMKAWEKIRDMRVKVEYQGVYKNKHHIKIIELEEYYKTFYAAIQDGQGGIRELLAFKDNANENKSDIIA